MTETNRRTPGHRRQPELDSAHLPESSVISMIPKNGATLRHKLNPPVITNRKLRNLQSLQVCSWENPRTNWVIVQQTKFDDTGGYWHLHDFSWRTKWSLSDQGLFTYKPNNPRNWRCKQGEPWMIPGQTAYQTAGCPDASKNIVDFPCNT